MKKSTLLNQLGFEVNTQLFEELNKKENKVNAEIKQRIAESEYYTVYANEEFVTVVSQYLVSTKEIKKMEKATGKTYIKANVLMDKNGLREQFINATVETEEVTEVIESSVTVQQDNKEDEMFIQCFKEAEQCNNKNIVAELDNLHENNIRSIVTKVLHEVDMIEEEQRDFDGINKRSQQAYMKKARIFLDKWQKEIAD